MKRLRIAMFSPYDPAVAGGVQEQLYWLSKGLEEEGHNVIVFGPPGKPIHHYSDYRGVGKLVPMPWIQGNWVQMFISNGSREKIFTVIRREHVDVLHFHDPFIPIFSWELVKDISIPKVATFHTAWDKQSVMEPVVNSIFPFFRQLCLDNLSAAVFVNTLVQKRWSPLAGDVGKQYIISNGVDPLLTRQSARAKGGPSLLFTGRLVKRKGLHYALEALTHLLRRFPNAHLDVLGDGQERDTLESYVMSHGLSHAVTFHGFVVGNKKRNFFEQADIFCAPYQDEAFGITILEAMVSGVPIVGFRNDAFREVLRKYPSPRLLVRSGDSRAFARALTYLLEHPKLHESLSEWCVAESKKYSWKKSVCETQKVYEAICV